MADVCGFFYLHERHIWYRLDLASPRRVIDLPGGFTLVRGKPEDVAFLEQFEAISVVEARQRLDAGAAFWMVRHGPQAAFCCWIFQDRTPVFAARTGWLPLPSGTVCLEDSLTAPHYRGRGIASAAWLTIADVLARDGVTAIVTKIEQKNMPSRGAAEKIGFRAVASMNLVRVAFRSWVSVEPQGDDSVSKYLVERLSR